MILVHFSVTAAHSRRALLSLCRELQQRQCQPQSCLHVFKCKPTLYNCDGSLYRHTGVLSMWRGAPSGWGKFLGRLLYKMSLHLKQQGECCVQRQFHAGISHAVSAMECCACEEEEECCACSGSVTVNCKRPQQPYVRD